MLALRSFWNRQQLSHNKTSTQGKEAVYNRYLSSSLQQFNFPELAEIKGNNKHLGHSRNGLSVSINLPRLFRNCVTLRYESRTPSATLYLLRHFPRKGIKALCLSMNNTQWYQNYKVINCVLPIHFKRSSSSPALQQWVIKTRYQFSKSIWRRGVDLFIKTQLIWP